MRIPKFWSLDMDTEGQIYDNLVWDLPGYRPRKPARHKGAKRPARKTS